MRVGTATNRPLEQEVAHRRFRDDLLYRLDVVCLQVPPLRERGKDVLLLPDHFWSQVQLLTESRAPQGVDSHGVGQLPLAGQCAPA